MSSSQEQSQLGSANANAEFVNQIVADAAEHGVPLDSEATAAIVARARASSVHTRRRAMMNHLATVPGVWPPAVSFFDSGEHSVISAGISLQVTPARRTTQILLTNFAA